MLAGTGITFGRYTGVTPKDGKPGNGQLTQQRAYTTEELELLAEGKEDRVPIPFEECYSRQDAAFQAGWMDERSRRFRLRHVLYETLEKEPERIWSLERLCDHMLERSIELQILKQGAFDDEASLKRIMWFLLEEFASTGQRRASLETLALAEVVTEGVAVKDWPKFYARWAEVFDVEPEGLARLVRLLVDYYRRRGLLSHELLQRRWDTKDPEVRRGFYPLSRKRS